MFEYLNPITGNSRVLFGLMMQEICEVGAFKIEKMLVVVKLYHERF